GRVDIAALLALAEVSAVATARPARASAAARTRSVTPAAGLRDQVVQVRWTGFDPTWTVSVFQCKHTVNSMADCCQVFGPPSGEDLGTGIGDALTNADGTGNATFEVRGATDLPELDCS